MSRKRSSQPLQAVDIGEPYSPLNFIVRARNDNDHSDFIPKTQVTPELKAEVMTWVDSPHCEFGGSAAAYVRWCLLFGAEFLRTLKPQHVSNASIIRAMELESARTKTRTDFMDHIESKAREAFELAGRGLHNQAARHVYAVLLEIRKLDPSDEWRGIYEKEVKKRFGKLLTRGSIVSHVPEKPPKPPQPHPDWGMEAEMEVEGADAN